MTPYFSSRDPAYRAPVGAVAAGTSVHFRLRLPRHFGVRAAFLLVFAANMPAKRDGMFWAGQPDGDTEWWECDFAPAAAGIYRYGFELTRDDGTAFLVALPDGTANVWRKPGALWQLTCFEKDFKTPDWAAGGIMYQIFPDRFFCSGKPKTAVPADRVLRDDWGGQPMWQPDAAGKVRNDDYFGGDLDGITEKLDYLQSLGVTCLYLNPIFEAHSNHRYDTADYEHLDPLLGDETALATLMRKAKARGMRVLLDGVFSHTGADSKYFNREGRYGDGGAYRDVASPYYPWYHFDRWPDQYASWWGFDTLPELDELAPSFMAYITGENGIVRQRIEKGAGGWRLDVADELPDGFLYALRRAVKAADPDALLLGEVWEDASCKESYGHLRPYLLGRQLDSVMNYPFRDAIFRYMNGGSATDFANSVEQIAENYPPQVLRLLMNHIGTHDTERALTVLAGEPSAGRGRHWQARQRLSAAEREKGVRRLRLATLLQFCLPGVPCIYYGDEAGMEGYRDPFNRGCYPWGSEDTALIAWYKALGAVRRGCSALKEGRFAAVRGNEDIACFVRADESETLLCAVNRAWQPAGLALPAPFENAAPVIGDGRIENGVLSLPAESGGIFLVKTV